MASLKDDTRWMERALGQAELSVGLASPNPAVGCVLVRDGEAVGEGFHEYDSRDHAEIVALRKAGPRARGATAYVTLEPCSHHGRTGPCADALIAAGVRRVVAATEDPNPLVHGRGMARLREAGLVVQSGVLEEPARRLNDSFAKFVRTSQPFVTMKVAATLDGRIAPAKRSEPETYWITGEEARAEAHRMRHAADALMVGVGTILADDPLLTDRSNLPRRRPLLRIVLDSKLRTPLDSKLVRSANGDVLILFTEPNPKLQEQLAARGVLLEQMAQEDSRIPLAHALRGLGKMQITHVLLEGGAQAHTAALNRRLVDKLVIFYAPNFFGQQATAMLGALETETSIQDYVLQRFGRDFALTACLHDPWAAMV